MHLEVSQSPDKNARRMIMKHLWITSFAVPDKIFKRSWPNMDSALTQTESVAEVTGLASEDFDHNDIGLTRGSAQVTTVWELHLAIVKLVP